MNITNALRALKHSSTHEVLEERVQTDLKQGINLPASHYIPQPITLLWAQTSIKNGVWILPVNGDAPYLYARPKPQKERFIEGGFFLTLGRKCLFLDFNKLMLKTEEAKNQHLANLRIYLEVTISDLNIELAEMATQIEDLVGEIKNTFQRQAEQRALFPF